MSGETVKQTSAEPRVEKQAETPLEQLMGKGRIPAKKTVPADKVVAPAPAAPVEPEHEPEPAAAAPRPRFVRLLVLRVLLVLNVAAIAAVLILPFGPQPAPRVEPAAGPHADPAPVEKVRLPVYPDKDLYNRALELANSGKSVEAVQALEEYLRRNPALPSRQRMGIYLQMQHYNSVAGRTQQAEGCLAAAQALMERSFLPEDLLAGAALAEKGGNGAEMRRSYARFLLLQKSLPAALRERISEAYLKLGDSYRIEAEQGEQRAQQKETRQPRLPRPRDGHGK